MINTLFKCSYAHVNITFFFIYKYKGSSGEKITFQFAKSIGNLENILSTFK